MVGKAVLFEAIEDERISEILLITRTSVGIEHSKVKELLISRFEELPNLDVSLTPYDACFHCMGVSSVGMSEKDFNQVTFKLTKILIDALHQANPAMTVSYVSGAGTDSSEKGKVMWARVKGKTENYILNKGFKNTYMIRLGGLLPEKGIKSKTRWYNAIYFITRPLFPLLKLSKNIITTTNFGQAMINTLFFPPEKEILENRDLNRLANKLIVSRLAYFFV